MNLLLEDILTDAELDAIKAVLGAESVRFDLLAAIAGLDPKVDFRFTDLRWVDFSGADLRGFDFTGSDLRFCRMNRDTVLDDSTILTDAKTSWIAPAAESIVEAMQKVRTASSPEQRYAYLDQLVQSFGHSTHVVEFLVNCAIQANSLEEFLDFCDFIPYEPGENARLKLSAVGSKLILRKIQRARSRTGRFSTAKLSIDSIVERLSQVEDSLSERILMNLRVRVDSKSALSTFPDSAFIELGDIQGALFSI